MCGRTTLGVSKKTLENHYHAVMPDDFHPTYNAAPSQKLPIVRNLHPQLIELARWGFLPSWLREKRKRGFINTRAETALEKPVFKSAVISRRCLVPADGFFEWDQSKQPYYFFLPRHRLFSFAGIWEKYIDEKGREILTYSIMTREANKFVEGVHNRMPVILHDALEKRWLDDDLSAPQIKELLATGGELRLDHYPIGRLVNSPAHNNRRIIERLQ